MISFFNNFSFRQFSKWKPSYSGEPWITNIGVIRKLNAVNHSPGNHIKLIDENNQILTTSNANLFLYRLLVHNDQILKMLIDAVNMWKYAGLTDRFKNKRMT